MHQQLWGYKVEEKLYVGVREQKIRLNTTGIGESRDKALRMPSREVFWWLYSPEHLLPVQDVVRTAQCSGVFRVFVTHLLKHTHVFSQLCYEPLLDRRDVQWRLPRRHTASCSASVGSCGGQEWLTEI